MPSRALTLAFVLLLFTSNAHAQWTNGSIDTTPGNVGRDLDMVVDPGGTLHVAYFAASDNQLRYATNDGFGWTIETIYNTSWFGGNITIALAPSGRPMVSFMNSASGQLMVSQRTGTNDWGAEVAADPPVNQSYGFYSSIVVSSIGSIFVAYHESPAQTLGFATKPFGGDWSSESLASIGTISGDFSLVVSEEGSFPTVHTPRIFYDDQGNGDLRVAYPDPQGQWNFEIVDDGPPGSADGRSCDAKIWSDGTIRVSYFKTSSGQLKMVTGDGTSAWQMQVVDSGNLASTGTSMDYPRIAYWNWDTKRLEVAFETASGWNIQSLNAWTTTSTIRLSPPSPMANPSSPITPQTRSI